MLAVGAPGQNKCSGGIDFGEFGGDNCPATGAAYVFLKNPIWQQSAYVKAPDPLSSTSFGWAIDFAEEGGRMVVTAPGLPFGIPGKVYIY